MNDVIGLFCFETRGTWTSNKTTENLHEGSVKGEAPRATGREYENQTLLTSRVFFWLNSNSHNCQIKVFKFISLSKIYKI